MHTDRLINRLIHPLVWALLLLTIWSLEEGCGPAPLGQPLGTEHATLLGEPHQLVVDWRAAFARGELARDAQGERLERYMAQLEVYLFDNDRWIATTRLCPHTGGLVPNTNGCNFVDSRYPECQATTPPACVSASWGMVRAGPLRRAPVIYLTRAPTTDGHVVGLRHEAIHVVAAAIGDEANAVGHPDARLWGARGLLWQRGPKQLRPPGDVVCALGHVGAEVVP